MTIYTVSTKEKKNVEEREVWAKDDLTIIRITGFRWGSYSIEVEDGEELDIDPENPDGIDMNCCGYDAELISMDDGWYGDVEYPESMSDEERERMDALWEEDYYSAWEGDGWIQTDTEAMFYGPLEITKED
jgi:hypothetical protein